METKIVLAVILLACGIWFSGCTTKKIELSNWGPRIEFYESKTEGYDFHIGANAIDKVDSRRGASKF